MASSQYESPRLSPDEYRRFIYTVEHDKSEAKLHDFHPINSRAILNYKIFGTTVGQSLDISNSKILWDDSDPRRSHKAKVVVRTFTEEDQLYVQMTLMKGKVFIVASGDAHENRHENLAVILRRRLEEDTQNIISKLIEHETANPPDDDRVKFDRQTRSQNEKCNREFGQYRFGIELDKKATEQALSCLITAKISFDMYMKSTVFEILGGERYNLDPDDVRRSSNQVAYLQSEYASLASAENLKRLSIYIAWAQDTPLPQLSVITSLFRIFAEFLPHLEEILIRDDIDRKQHYQIIQHDHRFVATRRETEIVSRDVTDIEPIHVTTGDGEKVFWITKEFDCVAGRVTGKCDEDELWKIRLPDRRGVMPITQ